MRYVSDRCQNAVSCLSEADFLTALHGGWIIALGSPQA